MHSENFVFQKLFHLCLGLKNIHRGKEGEGGVCGRFRNVGAAAFIREFRGSPLVWQDWYAKVWTIWKCEEMAVVDAFYCRNFVFPFPAKLVLLNPMSNYVVNK